MFSDLICIITKQIASVLCTTQSDILFIVYYAFSPLVKQKY